MTVHHPLDLLQPISSYTGGRSGGCLAPCYARCDGGRAEENHPEEVVF